MLLSYTELKNEVQNKIMTPVPDAHVNASSVDVTLGTILLTEVPVGLMYVSTNTPVLLCNDQLVLRDRDAMRTHRFDLSTGPYVLKPGEFVLAQTAEMFFMPLDMSAEFRLKSSVARMGISHALAVWADPGWSGSVMTLELHNISRYHDVVLTLGARIGQMVFHRHAAVPEEFAYGRRGAYNNDTGPSGAKPIRPVGDQNSTDS